MKSVLVSAPGKAIVSGEYAVLAGAPAICTAVNRRARVRIVPTNESTHYVTTPGHIDGSWSFGISDSAEIEWTDSQPSNDLRLIEEAWRIVSVGKLSPCSIIVDTREFSDPATGQKLGLGSSAAAMTALVCALRELRYRRGRYEPGHSPNDEGSKGGDSLARRAHSALQDGLGSGVDVATSFHGGVIEYKMGSAQAPIHHLWPGGLVVRLLWSGQPAQTKTRIRKLGAGDESEKGWSDLTDAANMVASVWASGHSADVLAALSNYTRVLCDFNNHRDLGIFDAGHDELSRLAEDSDVVYKPSGAGGGDIGMVFATDEAVADDFVGKATEKGFTLLSAALDSSGVEVSVED